MSRSPIITHVNAEGISQVVDILAAAFHDYAAMRFFFGPEPVDYKHKLHLMINLFSQSRFQLDLPPLLLQVDNRPVAAALLNPPLSKAITPALRQMLSDLATVVGSAVMSRLLDYEDCCEEMEPEVPHYYLEMIGVLPDLKGRGYARMLLEHIHKLVDEDPDAAGVCLNTENPGNLPFYRHFGYEVTGEADVGPLHTWSLFRPSN